MNLNCLNRWFSKGTRQSWGFICIWFSRRWTPLSYLSSSKGVFEHSFLRAIGPKAKAAAATSLFRRKQKLQVRQQIRPNPLISSVKTNMKGNRQKMTSCSCDFHDDIWIEKLSSSPERNIWPVDGPVWVYGHMREGLFYGPPAGTYKCHERSTSRIFSGTVLFLECFPLWILSRRRWWMQIVLNNNSIIHVSECREISARKIRPASIRYW